MTSDHTPDPGKMVPARCEPPEHLSGVDGWHWVARGTDDTGIAYWEADGNLWFRSDGQHGNAQWATDVWGWTYLSPVPSPEALARLVEAARGVAKALPTILAITPEGAALTAALAPFGDVK